MTAPVERDMSEPTKVTPTTVHLWRECSRSDVLDAIIRRAGYMGLYAEHDQAAIKGLRTLGYVPGAIIDRFPLTPFGVDASLTHFATSKDYGAWMEMVKRATLPSVRPVERRTYVAYLRPPKDLNGDRISWNSVVDRLRIAGAVACMEWADDSFSLECYEELMDIGLLWGFEPSFQYWHEKFDSIPRFVTQAMLELPEMAKWPMSWPSTTKGFPPHHIILPPAEQRFSPEWIRGMTAWGFSTAAWTHRVIEAATSR